MTTTQYITSGMLGALLLALIGREIIEMISSYRARRREPSAVNPWNEF